MLKKSIITAAGALFAMLLLGNPIKADAMAQARAWKTYITETGYFYDQLSPRMKKIYKAQSELMVEKGSRVISRFTIDSKLGFTEESDLVTADEANTVTRALMYDHPAMVYRVNDEHTDIIIDGTSTDNVLNQAAGIISNASGMSDSEKAKYFHDYLVNNVSYIETANNKQIAYGALIEKKAVCEGYARAYALLCHMGGVENVLQYGHAMGIDHAWNIVKLQDNQWYEVDCTWDDDGDGNPPAYEFFLITNQEMESKYHVHYDGTADDQSGRYTGLSVPVATGTTYAYVPEPSSTDTSYNPNEDQAQSSTQETSGNSTDSVQQAENSDATQNATQEISDNGQQSADNNNVAQDSNVTTDDSSEKDIVSGKVYTATSGEDIVVTGSEACIVKGSGSSIPSHVTVEGHTYEVTEIGAEAYLGNKDIKSITIPKSVKKVGSRAFADCTNLRKIKFAGKNVKKIGKKAFWNIGKKATINIPKKVYDKYVKLIKKSKPTKGMKYKKK
ncbi:leucine-rich repeat protein [Butyrivibrio sp. AC2005]|uniref:leucine-rich repeat protein n=1 Tax=Butyrivibrio sp. AC2005 TaxID=1280672 RepID=UPI000426B722|nr:leucine-rich repeat protein [Butyrivibrio sp. AC2005]